MPVIETRLTERYSTKHPFVCAGMGFICDTPHLGLATMRAGGIGALAGTLLSPETLGAAIDTLRDGTSGAFHVNLLTCFPYDLHVEICADKQVPIVSFHWGLPVADAIERLLGAGVSVWAQVGTVEDAVAAADAGCDAIVVQGFEAGGHNYAGLPLMALLPAVKDVVRDRLVIGAGGIADGRGVAAALALGADGVWVGTRMVATPEANAHAEHRRRIVAATGADTVLSSVYGPEFPTFNPMRMIRNDTIDAWDHRLDALPTNRDDLDAIGQTMFGDMSMPVKPFDAIVPVPETTGDFDQMPMLCGQGSGLITAVEPAETVISRMMNEAATILAGLGSALVDD